MSFPPVLATAAGGFICCPSTSEHYSRLLLDAPGTTSSWLSPSGDFAFGFQQIEANSSSYLLAVWFNKIPEETVVWYAKSSSDGQESSVQVPSSSVLRLIADGLLSLRNPSGDEVWSPRVPGVAYAGMLDTGNFRLVGVDGKAKWESFDFPADTILPTQVLSVGQQDKGWMEHGGGKEKRR
ncbi:hypothetical protein ZWY2020_016251 [Hordeum vulgare]|nr:hypothetical protein ZWY2020_016251 [Hordeum vulgare]